MPPHLSQHGVTLGMMSAYSVLHKHPLRDDRYGYAGGTTQEKASLTRAQNKAITAAAAGTGGTEDPVFRRRWAALSEHFRNQS